MMPVWDAFQREMLAGLGLEPLQRAPPAYPDDPLSQALLRAVGCDRDAIGLGQVLSLLPPAATLRDPAAKRAAWPRLRGLRRGLQ